MAIDTLLPKKLGKAEDSYKSVIELDEVLSSAEKLRIKNIALTGPYGSGKSSVLITLMEDFPKGRNYLPISLATLQANDEILEEQKEDDKNTESTKQQCPYNKEEKKENTTENLNRKIEYSILQQLIYREKAKTVPNSRFRRIVHLSKRELIRYPIYAVLSLVCFFILFEPDFAKVESIYNFFSWGYTWNMLFDFLAAGYLLGVLFFTIRYIFRSYSNSKLNKLNLKDAEIEVVENNSIFNRHLDEILYFFQVTKYDVVIIEDLDRFGTPNIFLKLRELNQLINESKIVGRHITFIYAVKDDIFKDEERTKFFDYIITVIPVINPSNSKDKLKAALKAKGCDNEISDDDLSEMAFFIQDMRILTNIVNEYKQYSDKLCANQGVQLNKTKLLAMIVYKNYYPQDFALLHRRQGKIYECINSKNLLVDEALKVVESKKSEIAEKEKSFLNNLHIQLSELRLVLLYKWRTTINQTLISINIDNTYYSLEQIAENEELFAKLLSMQTIQYRYHYYYGNYNTNSQNNDIVSFVKTNHYNDRLNLLKSDKGYFKTEYKLVQLETIHVKSLLIKDLISKYNLGKSNTYQKLGLSDMQDIFIRLGYIDEEYYDYISYFYPEMVSSEDRALLLSIKRQIDRPYNSHIDKIENFVKELKDYMFESDAILNIELLDFLAFSNKTNKEKFEHFMSRLERDNAPIQFLSQYYTEGKQGEIVFKHYIENTNAWSNIIGWQNTEERDNLIEAYLKYSSKLDDVAQEWLNNHFEFLVNHIDGISLDRALILTRNSDFTSLCYGSDDLLDYVIENSNYEINLSNLVIITKHLCAGDITITEESLNYSRIKQTNNENFIAYVNNNISAVIVVLKNTNKDDSVDNILYILNSNDIEANVKKQYLTGAINRIEDFSGIVSSALYDIAIETRIVLPTWDNTSFYFSSCKEEIPNIFYDYINYYAEELSQEKCPVSLDNTTDLYVDLFGYNQLSIENYKELLPSFAGEFPQIDLLADLEHKRLSILISSGRVPFSQQVLAEINKTNALAEYISFHAKAFMQQLDWEYNFNNRNVQEILSSGVFSIDEKYNIIGIIPFNIIQSSQSIANIVIDTFCKKQKVNIEFDLLVNLAKVSNDINKKLELIVIAVKNGCHDHNIIRQLLNDVGDPYTDVGEKNRKPLLSNNILNRSLLDALAKIKFISSYKPEKEDKCLRVQPTKNIYYSFTK